jgi:hypothetical protein
MLDLNHLPKTGNGNIDYFYNTGGTSSWVTWEKPKGIGTIVITCIGSGGGGRSGYVGSLGSNGGGAGGGSGGFTRAIIPAIFLPDVLYVTVGKGGAGGAAATSSSNLGTAGTASYVSIAPSSNSIYLVCYASGGGTTAITNSGTNAGGIGGLVATQANCLMSGLGQFFALAGQAGTNGESATPTSVTYPITGLLLSGGGAGCGFSAGSTVGASVIAPTQASFSLITTRTGGSTGIDGVDGLSILQPLMSIGGAGGGRGGGRGGNGGFGSGGGGGGGNVSPSGAGGNGGDGLVIIQCF